MPLATPITAKGNVGAGTDQLAMVDTASGKAGVVALSDDNGGLINAANPLEVQLVSSAVTSNRTAALLTSYNQSGVITVNTVLATLDCSLYRSISIQCTSMGSAGVVTPEWSNDNSTWVAATIFTQAGASATTFNAAGLWLVPVFARYLRLRLSTATTAGTTTLSIHQFDTPSQEWLATQPVSGTVTATVANATLAAGTAAIGDVGIQYRANATGAASMANILSPATPAAQVVKGSAGRLLSIAAVNTNAAARFLKVFNATTATLGTTSATWELALPPNQVVTLQLPGGMAMTTGITIAVTAAQGLTNNGAVTGNEVTGVVCFA